ncbi:ammonium transporter [Nocardia yamanashiensis]|uniref:ammonium transporter n=1 Tax=Nocardia yamanashiensis TaxID=209247 RepID=UPI000A06E145|nr:ammonium transporter [Nocardia yamanashiensis]
MLCAIPVGFEVAGVNSGDTAWLLASAALVMLMTPGLAFFYGGMVGGKSVLNMLMMNFVCLGVVTMLWAIYGYSEAFGADSWQGLIGSTKHVLLRETQGTVSGPAEHQVPTMAFVMFQLMFAVITTALISGAIAGRAKFWAWVLFVVGWTSLVYFPVAHWVFSVTGYTATDASGNSFDEGGWITNQLKAFDFAGGTAVHINAGAAALALVLVVGRRHGWPRNIARPHNVPFTLLGAALLWFGWYGFNAGSALTAGDLAALAFTNTTIAAGVALLGWIIVEQFRDGKPTALGAASGAVAGLVAITPACGFVGTLGALVIGFTAGAVCALAVGLKFSFGYDDSLDVVGVHLGGGLVGTLLTGVFADARVNPAGGDGLLSGGGWTQLQRQVIAASAVLAYSFLVTLLLAWLIDKLVGFRIDPEAEATGIDEAEHAETAYDLDSPEPPPHRPAPPRRPQPGRPIPSGHDYGW